MVTPLNKAATSILLDPGAPGWAQRLVLRLGQSFVSRWPTAPVQMFAVNKVDLPPAAEWRGCVVMVPDQTCIAVSDGAIWRKIIMGGAV